MSTTTKLYLIFIGIFNFSVSYGQNIDINPSMEVDSNLSMTSNKIIGNHAAILGGTDNIALGNYTAAAGYKSIAYSYGEWVVGLYNTPYNPINKTSWEGLDRLFVIGNGTHDTLRSNALTVYKNGIININDAYSLPNVDGLPHQVLASDGNGVTKWQSIKKILSHSSEYPTVPSFTPSSTTDARGNVGDVSWDNHFIYIKTSAGWKRSTLSTF